MQCSACILLLNYIGLQRGYIYHTLENTLSEPIGWIKVVIRSGDSSSQDPASMSHPFLKSKLDFLLLFQQIEKAEHKGQLLALCLCCFSSFFFIIVIQYFLNIFSERK